MRIKGEILVPLHRRAAARQLAVEFAVMETQVFTKQIGHRFQHRSAFDQAEKLIEISSGEATLRSAGAAAVWPGSTSKRGRPSSISPKGRVLTGFLDPALMLRAQRLEILLAVGRLEYDNAAFPELGLLCFG